MDTSKNNDINITKYKGFPSFYEALDECRWETKNEGFKYENTLFERSTSFFPYLNKLMSNLINSVKYLRNFNNYAVRKDYKRID